MSATCLSSVIIVTVALRVSYCDYIDEIREIKKNATAADLQYTNRVLICLQDDQAFPSNAVSILTSNYDKLSFELYAQQACSTEVIENFNQSILAVVAPEPIEGVDSSEIPIYFYDYHSTDSAQVVFRNAVVSSDWRKLRLAFTRFLQEQQWSRISIISDDSWYSAEFEKELVEHFREKQLMYRTVRCVQVSPTEPCDFDEAVKFLKDNTALIVVANVGHEHSVALRRAVRKHETTEQRGFVWLTRDWRLSRDMAKDIGMAFSITLAPKLRNELRSLFTDMETIDNDPPLTGLLHGVFLVIDAVQSTMKERIDYYYRDITRHIDDSATSDNTQAYVQKFVNRSASVIAVGTVTGQIQFHYRRPAFRTQVSDVVGCFMRSKEFERPCNDILLVIFMFVLIMTVLMIFFLTFFFNEYRSVLYPNKRIN